MPSPAFIKAASAANRQPVVLLAIESVDAIKRQITTQSDWQAATPVNLNTVNEPGRVFMTTDGAEPYPGIYWANDAVPTSLITPQVTFPFDQSIVPGGLYNNGPDPSYATNLATASFSLDARTTGSRVACRISLEGSMVEPNQESYPGLVIDVRARSVDYVLQGKPSGGAWQDLKTGKAKDLAGPPPLPGWGAHSVVTIEGVGLARGAWEFRIVLTSFNEVEATGWSDQNSRQEYKAEILSYTQQYETQYKASSSLVTAPMDLGLTPSIPSRFEADDVVPTGGAISYHGYGSDNGSSWADLGVIRDGNSLPPYRYYYISAVLTSGGLYSPAIDELRVVGGNSQYVYISTHKDVPIQGALPYIAPGGISSISSKINLTDQATVGELSIKLFWRKKTGDMLATGFLKNKNIICKIGFVGLSEQDYEPYFTGTWHDYQADHEKQIISVKTRDVLKKFTRKVPDAAFYLDTTGAAFNPPRLYKLAGNIMAVMLEIADLLGVPDRYLDRAAFDAIAAGPRSGANWQVSRDLKEPLDAGEMMNELAISAGVFLVELPDGRLTAKLYDQFLTDPPAATLDAMVHKFKPIEGGQKELFTRQAIYYQLLSGADGGSASDYGKGHIYINVLAETNWNESATKEWMDRWGLSVHAIQLLALRRDSWFANPRNTVTVENVPPRFWELERGQVVAVDNLRLPCPEAEWQGYTVGVRYLVMGKTISDPTSTNLSFSYDLLSLADAEFAPDPDFPVYTPLDFWPLVTSLELSERLILLPGGSLQAVLDVSFDQPADFHSGGAQVWSRENGGSWVFQATVGYGGPSVRRVVTFNVFEKTTVEVAVLTINAAGLTQSIDSAPHASHIVIGKAAPPADISGLALSFRNGFAYFTWDKSPDLDVNYSGAIVLKHSGASSSATWATANVVGRFSGASTSAVVPAASGTYLIKAEDSSGNQSVNAIIVISDVPAMMNINEVAGSIEAPAFAGVKSNCIVTNGLLTLTTTTLLDSLAGDWDSFSGSFDDLPGIQTGTYDFLEPVVFNQVNTCILLAWLESSVVNISASALFDDRIGNIDSWLSFDEGDGNGAAAILMLSTSQDGITWSPWAPYAAGEYRAKSFKFRLNLFSYDPNFTVQVKRCAMRVDMTDILQSGAVTVPVTGSHVNFPSAFYSPAPHLSFTIYDAVAGDYAAPSNVTAAGFDIVIKDQSNIPVERVINWFAKGY